MNRVCCRMRVGVIVRWDWLAERLHFDFDWRIDGRQADDCSERNVEPFAEFEDAEAFPSRLIETSSFVDGTIGPNPTWQPGRQRCGHSTSSMWLSQY